MARVKSKNRWTSFSKVSKNICSYQNGLIDGDFLDKFTDWFAITFDLCVSDCLSLQIIIHHLLDVLLLFVRNRFTTTTKTRCNVQFIPIQMNMIVQ